VCHTHYRHDSSTSTPFVVPSKYVTHSDVRVTQICHHVRCVHHTHSHYESPHPNQPPFVLLSKYATHSDVRVTQTRSYVRGVRPTHSHHESSHPNQPPSYCSPYTSSIRMCVSHRRATKSKVCHTHYRHESSHPNQPPTVLPSRCVTHSDVCVTQIHLLHTLFPRTSQTDATFSSVCVTPYRHESSKSMPLTLPWDEYSFFFRMLAILRSSCSYQTSKFLNMRAIPLLTNFIRSFGTPPSSFGNSSDNGSTYRWMSEDIAYTYKCIYIHICMYVYVYMYICIYISV